MTNAEVTNLRNELNKVLEKFNKTSDIQVELGDASFGIDVTFKLIGAKKDKNGDIITKKSMAFLEYEYIHHIPSKLLNYEFKHDRSTYKIIGYNIRSKKYPIEYIKDGKPFKCSVQYMKDIIKQSIPEMLFV